MDEILRLLVSQCSFLWARGYTIARSGYGADLSSAYIDIVPRSNTMKLEVLYERGMIYLDVYSLVNPTAKDRFPIDILRTIVTGEPYLGDVVTEAHIAFLRDNIDTVERIFVDERKTAELNQKVGEHIKLRLKLRRDRRS